ncbi:hypothetical protein CXQ80_23685 [Pseudomonas sp. 02C 26]|uniref:DUF3077 domain-containing protein n=1 Tax=Pseudomonas sp. 02C 26 TaxID=2054914 RepID=UPI000C6D926A|nr:DUF3077 domain-containing protein [Pseudomonas sp. 02C 26]AUF98623.1 hypothetical protein CXQ80_23685 [Pseudomonas sp. 02C 26]
MTKKLVPDPPLPLTTSHPFGRCEAGHPPLYSVNPNIPIEDALVNVALHLRCAYETGLQAMEHMREEGRGLFWANLHAVEAAEGVVESLLDNFEAGTLDKRMSLT